MPVYRYECPVCDLSQELIVPVDRRDSQVCLKCGTVLTRKLDAPGYVWHPTKGK
jgi:putative FmdB family regulatory protein